MAASAPAAGGEPQKQPLSIIRDFTAAPKSHGERAVSGLKRRLDGAELQASKRAREGAETELRHLQTSIAAVTSQVLQATISNLQEEITKVGSELEALKSKNASERDEFISQVLDMDARIRQFQQMASVQLKEKCSELSTDGHNVSDKDKSAGSEGMLTDLADKVNSMEAEMHALEEEFQKYLLGHNKLCEEVADVRAKSSNRGCDGRDEVVAGGRGARAAEMEKVHNSVAEELQRRYACPGAARN